MHFSDRPVTLLRRCAHECAAAGAAAAGGVFLSYRVRCRLRACPLRSTSVTCRRAACAPACKLDRRSHVAHCRFIVGSTCLLCCARDVLVSSLGCSLYECDIPLKL